MECNSLEVHKYELTCAVRSLVGALGLRAPTGSAGAEVEGNGISSVSTLAGLSPGGQLRNS